MQAFQFSHRLKDKNTCLSSNCLMSARTLSGILSLMLVFDLLDWLESRYTSENTTEVTLHRGHPGTPTFVCCSDVEILKASASLLIKISVGVKRCPPCCLLTWRVYQDGHDRTSPRLHPPMGSGILIEHRNIYQACQPCLWLIFKAIYTFLHLSPVLCSTILWDSEASKDPIKIWIIF